MPCTVLWVSPHGKGVYSSDSIGRVLICLSNSCMGWNEVTEEHLTFQKVFKPIGLGELGGHFAPLDRLWGANGGKDLLTSMKGISVIFV